MLKQKRECLLLHGWGVKNSVWDHLAEQLNTYGLVTTPCLYALAEKTKDYKIESMAKLLSEALNDDCVVVAWSMGGLIATQLAGLSDKIKGIVYIASTPCFVNKYGWANTIDEKTIKALQSELLCKPAATLEYFAGLIAHGDESAKKTTRVVLENLAEEKNSEVLSCWLTELQKHDHRKNFAALKIPTQIILGEHDALLDSQIEKQITQLKPSTKSVVIKKCGHAPFISRQEETHKIINGFFNAEFKQRPL